jgi:hypothetical protein
MLFRTIEVPIRKSVKSVKSVDKNFYFADEVKGELKMPLHAASSRELSSSLRQFMVAGGV